MDVSALWAESSADSLEGDNNSRDSWSPSLTRLGPHSTKACFDVNMTMSSSPYPTVMPGRSAENLALGSDGGHTVATSAFRITDLLVSPPDRRMAKLEADKTQGAAPSSPAAAVPRAPPATPAQLPVHLASGRSAQGGQLESSQAPKAPDIFSALEAELAEIERRYIATREDKPATARRASPMRQRPMDSATASSSRTSASGAPISDLLSELSGLAAGIRAPPPAASMPQLANAAALLHPSQQQGGDGRQQQQRSEPPQTTPATPSASTARPLSAGSTGQPQVRQPPASQVITDSRLGRALPAQADTGFLERLGATGSDSGSSTSAAAQVAAMQDPSRVANVAQPSTQPSTPAAKPTASCSTTSQRPEHQAPDDSTWHPTTAPLWTAAALKPVSPPRPGIPSHSFAASSSSPPARTATLAAEPPSAAPAVAAHQSAVAASPVHAPGPVGGVAVQLVQAELRGTGERPSGGLASSGSSCGAADWASHGDESCWLSCSAVGGGASSIADSADGSVAPDRGHGGTPAKPSFPALEALAKAAEALRAAASRTGIRAAGAGASPAGADRGTQLARSGGLCSSPPAASCPSGQVAGGLPADLCGQQQPQQPLPQPAAVQRAPPEAWATGHPGPSHQPLSHQQAANHTASDLGNQAALLHPEVPGAMAVGGASGPQYPRAHSQGAARSLLAELESYAGPGADMQPPAVSQGTRQVPASAQPPSHPGSTPAQPQAEPGPVGYSVTQRGGGSRELEGRGPAFLQALAGSGSPREGHPYVSGGAAGPLDPQLSGLRAVSPQSHSRGNPGSAEGAPAGWAPSASTSLAQSAHRAGGGASSRPDLDPAAPTGRPLDSSWVEAGGPSSAAVATTEYVLSRGSSTAYATGSRASSSSDLAQDAVALRAVSHATNTSGVQGSGPSSSSDASLAGLGGRHLVQERLDQLQLPLGDEVQAALQQRHFTALLLQMHDQQTRAGLQSQGPEMHGVVAAAYVRPAEEDVLLAVTAAPVAAAATQVGGVRLVQHLQEGWQPNVLPQTNVAKGVAEPEPACPRDHATAPVHEKGGGPQEQQLQQVPVPAPQQHQLRLLRYQPPTPPQPQQQQPHEVLPSQPPLQQHYQQSITQQPLLQQPERSEQAVQTQPSLLAQQPLHTHLALQSLQMPQLLQPQVQSQRPSQQQQPQQPQAAKGLHLNAGIRPREDTAFDRPRSDGGVVPTRPQTDPLALAPDHQSQVPQPSGRSRAVSTDDLGVGPCGSSGLSARVLPPGRSDDDQPQPDMAVDEAEAAALALLAELERRVEQEGGDGWDGSEDWELQMQRRLSHLDLAPGSARGFGIAGLAAGAVTSPRSPSEELLRAARQAALDALQSRLSDVQARHNARRQRRHAARAAAGSAALPLIGLGPSSVTSTTSRPSRGADAQVHPASGPHGKPSLQHILAQLTTPSPSINKLAGTGRGPAQSGTAAAPTVASTSSTNIRSEPQRDSSDGTAQPAQSSTYAGLQTAQARPAGPMYTTAGAAAVDTTNVARGPGSSAASVSSAVQGTIPLPPMPPGSGSLLGWLLSSSTTTTTSGTASKAAAAPSAVAAQGFGSGVVADVRYRTPNDNIRPPWDAGLMAAKTGQAPPGATGLAPPQPPVPPAGTASRHGGLEALRQQALAAAAPVSGSAASFPAASTFSSTSSSTVMPLSGAPVANPMAPLGAASSATSIASTSAVPLSAATASWAPSSSFFLSASQQHSQAPPQHRTYTIGPNRSEAPPTASSHAPRLTLLPIPSSGRQSVLPAAPHPATALRTPSRYGITTSAMPTPTAAATPAARSLAFTGLDAPPSSFGNVPLPSSPEELDELRTLCSLARALPQLDAMQRVQLWERLEQFLAHKLARSPRAGGRGRSTSPDIGCEGGATPGRLSRRSDSPLRGYAAVWKLRQRNGSGSPVRRGLDPYDTGKERGLGLGGGVEATPAGGSAAGGGKSSSSLLQLLLSPGGQAAAGLQAGSAGGGMRRGGELLDDTLEMVHRVIAPNATLAHAMSLNWQAAKSQAAKMEVGGGVAAGTRRGEGYGVW